MSEDYAEGSGRRSAGTGALRAVRDPISTLIVFAGGQLSIQSLGFAWAAGNNTFGVLDI